MDELHPDETAREEHAADAVVGVVEDRHLVDELVAHLADRALEPVPAGEARDDGAGAELPHPLRERRRVGEVIEEPEPEHDLELALDRRVAEVAADELDLRLEPLQALAREVEHRLREVDADVGGRAVLEPLLGDPAGAAADVEHARPVVGVDDAERDVAPSAKPRPQLPLEEAVLVVEAVKRSRRSAKVTSYLRRGARCLGGGTHT